MNLYQDTLFSSILVYIYNMLPALMPMLPGLLVTAWARLRTRALRGVEPMTVASVGETGADLAARLLRVGGAWALVVVEARPPLANFVDIARGELRLCDQVYHGHSPEALAIAAQEAGHGLLATQKRRLFTVYLLLITCARIGILVSWLAILAGMLMISASIALRGSMLYTSLVFVLVLCRLVKLSANRRVRDLLPLRRLNWDELAFRRGLDAATWVEIAQSIPGFKRGRLPG